MPASDGRESLHQYGFMKKLSQRQHLRNIFFATFIAAQVSGLLMVAFVVIWAVNGNSAEQAAISASDSKVGGIGPFLGFYYHPVFMTIGMVFLTGQGGLDLGLVSYMLSDIFYKIFIHSLLPKCSLAA